MKLSLLALAVVPVLVGGIAITTAVSVLDPAEAPSPTPTLGKSTGDRSNRANTAGGVAESGDGTRVGNSTRSGDDTRTNGDTGSDDPGSDDDTEIDGRRPHLTVIDGRPAVAPPGPIPAAISILPPPSIALPPLSDLGGELAWPADDGDRRGRNAPGTDERGDSGAPGANGDAWTDASTSPRDPDSAPSGDPRDASPLGDAPEGPPRNDEGGVAEPGSGARPPAAGRPGRPPSDTINSPFPSDSVGRPGDESTGRPPSLVDPEPLMPGVIPLVPEETAPEETDVPDTVAPEETDVPDAAAPEETAAPDTVAAEETAAPDGGLADVEDEQPDEASGPTAEADVDDSQPPLR